MTGLYLDISDYIPDEEEMAADAAIAYLRRRGVEEEYIMVESKANQHRCIADACNAIRRLNRRSKA